MVILRHIVAVALLVSQGEIGLACSALATVDSAPAMVAGNYDWHARGGIAFMSPRGQVKQAFNFGKQRIPLQWMAKFASITLSQFGRDFPMQGINEAGLAGMVLAGEAEYPAHGPVGVIQESLWLQFQLDNYSATREVVEHVGDFGIEKISANLHWFICDAQNDCAVIEFKKGKVAVHHGAELIVKALTNTTYPKATQSLAAWRDTNSSLPQGYDSVFRFIRLAEMDGVNNGLSLALALDQVSLPSFTAWQTVFDLESKTIETRLDGGPWVEIRLTDVQAECGSSLPMLDLAEGRWRPYDHSRVATLFAEASKGTQGLGGERRSMILNASETIRCGAVGLD